jgi:flagellar motility protein MotE (MotC chaperone)
MSTLPLPRLLPLTMTMLGVVTATKCAEMAVAAFGGAGFPVQFAVVSPSVAADHLQEPPRPVASAARPPPATPAATAATAGTDAIPRTTPPPEAISESEKALLMALRQRNKELDAKASELAAREAILGGAEQRLGARVSELQSLQKRLEGLESTQKQREDASLQNLVKLYEAMKPREAALIFNELPMSVLLHVLERMKDVKAAAILAAMSPEKARDVTAGLAQVRTDRDTPPARPAGS